MNEEIRVHVVKYPDRENFVLRYLDPLTGKHNTKSAATAKRGEATKAAGKWQAELREGRYAKPSRITWEAFREHYAESALPALAAGTATTYEATLNVFERTCNPQNLSQVTTARLTWFVSKLRNNGLSEATIARHLRGLKVAMRWARKEGLLVTLPTFTMPKRVRGAKVMRGRAVTTEEFERMLESVPKVVENVAAASWKFYLQALWDSGLRLGESLTLSWEDARGAIVVDLAGRRPMLLIPAEAEKGNRDRLLPITPEFANLLAGVPEHERRGRVFKLLEIDGTIMQPTRRLVGPVVSAIGKTAGVVVDERIKRVKAERDKPAHNAILRKFASAHDLRRGFGVRWASKVMPTVLRELMRHEDIGTTMKYYVGQNAESTADALWAAAGNNRGNTRESAAGDDAKNTAKTSGDDRS